MHSSKDPLHGVTLEALEEQLAAQHTKVGASTQPRSAR